MIFPFSRHHLMSSIVSFHIHLIGLDLQMYDIDAGDKDGTGRPAAHGFRPLVSMMV